MRVHGCLDPQSCVDPVDFYHTGIAADVVNGIASFSSLSIDFAGKRFRLRFELEGSKGKIAVTGSYFEVVTGEPTYLHVHRRPALAYSNGQPFGQQPVVVVQDAGRNRIHQLSNLDGYVTASLMAKHQYRTNTSMVAVVFSGAGCTGKRRHLNEKDFPPGFMVDGWDACNDKWDDGADIVCPCDGTGLRCFALLSFLLLILLLLLLFFFPAEVSGYYIEPPLSPTH